MNNTSNTLEKSLQDLKEPTLSPSTDVLILIELEKLNILISKHLEETNKTLQTISNELKTLSKYIGASKSKLSIQVIKQEEPPEGFPKDEPDWGRGERGWGIGGQYLKVEEDE